MRQPDFQSGLLPAVVQDAHTHAVLMVGYMNEEAYRSTLETGWVTFYSRKRQALWVKGETSGHRLKLVGIYLDCDGDALLVQALPQGPTCHQGTYSCFSDTGEYAGSFLGHLWRIIDQRARKGEEGSYTVRLVRQGLPSLTQKVGEEAVETVVAALAQSPERVEEEMADLLYHLWVLLWLVGSSPEKVENILRMRHERSSRV
ncbi:MAG: bifunctional phosphoribosyl-AMP cyclohydrolase/phosphoribosyl-ATP diphosphatase HisIE [Bacteroidia bacterium]|nr:bifunctional phosphoribosyl-AMP cyclohydrolase/phosphoribosyl-ATP diphosphatase HisIE [Bacteroidia bacterium]